MRTSFAIVQDQGRRKRQEDYAAFEPAGSAGLEGAPDLIVLADGMGGHAGGDVASRTAVEAVLAVWRRTAGRMDERGRLRAGIAAANDAIDAAIGEQPELEGMGCTLVALRPTPEGLLWLSVGDSPMWRVRGGRVTRLNADHSRGQVLDAMVEHGVITADQAASDRDRNVLEHAVAGDVIEAIDEPWALEPLMPGDVVVLASDGLDTLPPDAVGRLCASGDAGAVARALLDAVLAEAKPNQDNVTIAVLRAEAGGGAAAGARPGSALAGTLALACAAALAAIVALAGPRVFPPKAPVGPILPPVTATNRQAEAPPEKPKPQAKAKLEDKPKADLKPKPADRPKPEVKAKPEVKPDARPKPAVEPKPKAETEAPPAVEPKPKPAPKRKRPVDDAEIDG